MSLDQFFHPSKNKYSSQHVHKRFKNRHRKLRDKPPKLNLHSSRARRGFVNDIEAGLKDFSSDEEMMSPDQTEAKTHWRCASCTFMNEGSFSQCSICGISRPSFPDTNRITLGDFLSRPQAMQLDDEPNHSNAFLQNAIHLSLQDNAPSTMFMQNQPSMSTTTTTTTTTTYSPFVDMPSARPVLHPSFPPAPYQHPRRRRHKPRPAGGEFDQYWSDAQEHNVHLPSYQHYERNPDDLGRSFQPLGTRQEFQLQFGVPRAISSAPSGRGVGRSPGNRKKTQREERKARKFYDFYRHIYVETSLQEKLEISRIIRSIYSYVPGELRQRKRYDGQSFDTCQACYAVDFDEKEDECHAVVVPHCGHRTLCSECFGQYLEIRIRDEDIVPWLPCPMPDCKTCVPPDVLVSYLSVQSLYKFTSIFLRQHLKRNSNWVSCETDDCDFGFVYNEMCTNDSAVCEACGHNQELKKNPVEDSGFGELIASGVMRLCPKCEWPTMKDYGMCNVMQCGQCGIWWNWRTRDCGTSSAAVKQRARMQGVMWEPGELEYQWDLQRTDLPAFIELLARNGIKYDPQYVRGRG